MNFIVLLAYFRSDIRCPPTDAESLSSRGHPLFYSPFDEPRRSLTKLATHAGTEISALLSARPDRDSCCHVARFRLASRSGPRDPLQACYCALPHARLHCSACS